jgi:hypothetical protein
LSFQSLREDAVVVMITGMVDILMEVILMVIVIVIRTNKILSKSRYKKTKVKTRNPIKPMKQRNLRYKKKLKLYKKLVNQMNKM